jgi:hypothetical protein
MCRLALREGKNTVEGVKTPFLTNADSDHATVTARKSNIASPEKEP